MTISLKPFTKLPRRLTPIILGPIEKRIVIEAASKFGWTKYVKNDDYILGMNNFGSSAPHKILYNKFGLNSKELVKLALKVCKK